jgi:hypothetical protein
MTAPDSLKSRADELLDQMPADGRPIEDRIRDAVEQARAEQNGAGPKAAASDLGELL